MNSWMVKGFGLAVLLAPLGVKADLPEGVHSIDKVNQAIEDAKKERRAVAYLFSDSLST